jgi:phosphate starvation-inducible PhoH-like protein
MARQNKKKSNGRIIRIQEEPREIRQSRKNYVTLIPRNIAQEEYIANLHDATQRIVIATGPAGTGKTYLAVQKAVQEFMNGDATRIVITRPAVTVDEDLGFLPGDMIKKMAPWTRPLMDVFEEYYSPKEISAMLEEGTIEVCPLAYMRGRTFKNCVIIFDEGQNTTISQMKMALTRIGEGTRMFITGDLKQSDLRRENGLYDFFKKLEACSSHAISLTSFTRDHIERDPIVTEILRCYGDDD